MPAEELRRRTEDQDRMLNQRLDELDKKAGSFDTSLTILKMEQAHIKELFTAKFATLDQSQALQLSKLEQLTLSVTAMISDADKSPMGRALHTHITTVDKQVGENKDAITELLTWKAKVEGGLALVTWLGFMGAAALVVQIIQFFSRAAVK